MPRRQESQQRAQILRLQIATVGRHIRGAAEDPCRHLRRAHAVTGIRQVRTANAAIIRESTGSAKVKSKAASSRDEHVTTGIALAHRTRIERGRVLQKFVFI